VKKPVKKPRITPGPRPKRAPYIILSFTVPAGLEKSMNAAASLRGMNRSQYIVWLVRQDLQKHGALDHDSLSG
jgi:hypothetical protein